jgi:hypothetical protein
MAKSKVVEITSKGKATIKDKDTEMTGSSVIKKKEEMERAKAKARKKFAAPPAEMESLPKRQKGFARTTNE